MVYVLADAPLAHLLHRRPRALSLPTGHAPIASGWSNSCRVGYLPPAGSTCPFHGARFIGANRCKSLLHRLSGALLSGSRPSIKSFLRTIIGRLLREIRPPRAPANG